MTTDFERFKKENQLSVETICRDFFNNSQGSLKIKKEAVVVKNLVTILNTTLKLSSEIGFQTMSLRDLSRESGLSMGALYTYFSSKDDLLRIIHSYGMQTVKTILTETVAGEADTHEKLRKIVRTHLYLSEVLQQWFNFFFMETKNLKYEDRKIPTESELFTEQVIVDILEEGRSSGIYTIRDTVLTAALIKALLQDWYLKRWKYAKRKISIEQYLAFIMDSIEAVILSKKGALL